MNKRKDLTPVAKDLEKVMKKHFPHSKGRIAVALCFSLPDDYQQVYFVTSVPRPMGIQMFQAAADKMKAQVQ